ncbi:MAG: 2-oxoacid:acceptor oxidoreductase subunit alpha [Actinomycetia bacterium]|nr:2-oxoacid:acceptor oxidoreductase subunit alpha [Actinomycetes bacterium]MCP3910699.1 2-oxoacid:acceptor oxidoreductase subunit alpha [Actinomycetes bacterium]
MSVSARPPTDQAMNLQGNEACALGAVAGGCRFYAGYPITPSSEIAEHMAAQLPPVDGVFIQMEDEIASMGAVLGASMGGARVMTATSGPGFSLMQEHIGFAAAVEVPCVIIDVMRGGPSTGMPTRPSQGDVMQARWGTHGDHTIIVLAPASVPEIYAETIRAFNLAEQLRSPVVILYDEIIGHLTETVDLSSISEPEIVERRWADGPADHFEPYAVGPDLVPAMARPGDGYRVHTTGLTHGDDGFPTQEPAEVERVQTRLLAKLDHHRDLIDRFETSHTEDADVLVVAYGITARAAELAVASSRQQGVKAALFRPVTVWPFPAEALVAAASGCHTILVPEMNAGQLILEVERLAGAGTEVQGLNRIDGEAIEPAQMIERLATISTSHQGEAQS